jgi:general secretion pathway protein I
VKEAAKMRQSGFTLLEVLIALAIVGAGIAVFWQLLSTGSRAQSSASDQLLAIQLAESRLRLASADTEPRSGDVAVDGTRRFHWSTTVSPLDYDIAGTQRANEEESPSAYRITVNVQWAALTATHEYSLSTIRIIDGE